LHSRNRRRGNVKAAPAWHGGRVGAVRYGANPRTVQARAASAKPRAFGKAKGMDSNAHHGFAPSLEMANAQSRHKPRGVLVKTFPAMPVMSNPSR
jgi:hypothetical protein